MSLTADMQCASLTGVTTNERRKHYEEKTDWRHDDSTNYMYYASLS